MVSLFLAGVIMSGSITQTVSHAQGHVNPQTGGTIVGTKITVTKTIPGNGPGMNAWLPLMGTQTVRHCAATMQNGYSIQFVTSDPRGCSFAGAGSPVWYWI